VRHPPVTDAEIRALREGVELEDGTTAPARVKRLGHAELELTIHEGRKRQVRRMLDAVGHPVIALRRVRFGTLRLGTLEEGAVRRLTDAEIEALRRAASGAATQTAIRGALRSGGPSRPRRR
jgi:23S rRNA pseudouridine2605 synthase